MNKQNEFPKAMNDMGEPSEMSPIKEVTNRDETETPIVEVNQPLKTQNHLEIRNRSS